MTNTIITCNNSYEAESIEKQLEKITQTNEPIESTAPLIYTERGDGVLPQYDVRTDRFDIAIEAMQKVSDKYRNSRIVKKDDKGSTSDNAGENTAGQGIA